jgi:hypothetical protein
MKEDMSNESMLDFCESYFSSSCQLVDHGFKRSIREAFKKANILQILQIMRPFDDQPQEPNVATSFRFIETSNSWRNMKIHAILLVIIDHQFYNLFASSIAKLYS